MVTLTPLRTDSTRRTDRTRRTRRTDCIDGIDGIDRTRASDPSQLVDRGDQIAAADAADATDAAGILSLASELLAAAAQGLTNSVLEGKQLGLMCTSNARPDSGKADLNPLEISKFDGQSSDGESSDGESSDAAFFRLAATGLGARVTRIRPRLSASSPSSELSRLSLLLGRFYDAVECQGLPLDLVRKIRAHAGVPVYFGLASAGHATAKLADQLTGNASPREKRLFVLQAALLHSLTQAETGR